jgi:AP-3 complex subunit delta-1
MLRPKVTTLPGHIQSIYVQNVVKLYSRLLAAGDGEVVRRASELLQDKLPMFIQSADLEVQERACSILQLVKYIQKMEGEAVTEVSALFAGELNPVAPKAQRKVPLPEG